MSDPHPHSRLPGFYRLPLEERQTELARQAGLSTEDLVLLSSGGIAGPSLENATKSFVSASDTNGPLCE